MGKIPTTPTKPRRHEWSIPTKNRLKGLVSAGWSYAKIARDDEEKVQ